MTKPFNSLGQILAGGGDVALGVAISHGASEQELSEIIDKRFAPISDEDRDALLEIAYQGSSASELLREIVAGNEIDLSTIPVNPQMFGDQSQGGRVTVALDVFSEAVGSIVQLRGTFADVPTADEIIAWIEDQLKTINDSAKYTMTDDELEREETSFDPLYFARRF